MSEDENRFKPKKNFLYLLSERLYKKEKSSSEISKFPNKLSLRNPKIKLEILVKNFIAEYNKTHKNKPLYSQTNENEIQVQVGKIHSTQFLSINYQGEITGINSFLKKTYPQVPKKLTEYLQKSF